MWLTKSLGVFHPLIKEAGIRIRSANFGRHSELNLLGSSYDGRVILGAGVYEKDKYPRPKSKSKDRPTIRWIKVLKTGRKSFHVIWIFLKRK